MVVLTLFGTKSSRNPRVRLKENANRPTPHNRWLRSALDAVLPLGHDALTARLFDAYDPHRPPPSSTVRQWPGLGPNRQGVFTHNWHSHTTRTLSLSRLLSLQVAISPNICTQDGDKHVMKQRRNREEREEIYMYIYIALVSPPIRTDRKVWTSRQQHNSSDGD